MKTINILEGDTLDGASVGDYLVNGYGELGQIVDESQAGYWWHVLMPSGNIIKVHK